jgi:hypothetical protein
MIIQSMFTGKDILTITLMAFLKSVHSCPVDWIAHKSVGKSARGRERWVLQLEIRVGGRCGWGWGQLL